MAEKHRAVLAFERLARRLQDVTMPAPSEASGMLFALSRVNATQCAKEAHTQAEEIHTRWVRPPRHLRLWAVAVDWRQLAQWWGAVQHRSCATPEPSEAQGLATAVARRES